MTRASLVRTLILALVLLVSLGGLYWTYWVPTTLRIAVPHAASEPSRFFSAFAETLRTARAPVRLEVSVHEQFEDAAEAIERGRADLAFIRPDYRRPPNATSVAIVHQFVVTLVARRGAGIARFADLKGKRVAVLSPGRGNMALFETLLAFHGLQPADLTVVRITTPEEIASDQPAADALFAAGPRAGGGMTQTVQAFARRARNVQFIGIPDAAAFAARNNVFAAAEINAGEFGRAPRLPAEAVQTIGFPALLVAAGSLSVSTVEAFTSRLFDMRGSLARDHPAASRFEALSTDRGTAFPLHPGAAAYYDGEKTSLIDRYSDWFYVAIFGFGAFASVGAWLISRLLPRGAAPRPAEFTGLVGLIEAARRAASHAELDEVERAFDAHVAEASAHMLDGTIEREGKEAFDLLIDRLTTVVGERRAELPRRAANVVTLQGPH
jgi:TRAP transporter TAXI family solute receptor